MALFQANPQDTQLIHRVADAGTIPDDPASNYVTTLTRGGPGGAVDTIVLTKDGLTWTKTLTYTGSDLTGVSAWVRS